MKTSWNELRLIEDFLLSDTDTEDILLFEANLLLQPNLKESVFWQQKTYSLVHKYGRLQLRKEIDQVHEKLFTAPEHHSFRQKIMQLFGK
ncbi:hypothetical protein HQN86_06605 [Pedobacter panaciterrae]|jgi:hypothetical protein|uniref:hypothetical protein n=1 Tax=Pedobacter panaciterrae TaxID=363849 RepID=UPI00155DDC11|nr:hypothetical protein [Pedobacter panaciterrae]NQX53281.1 hypothetical protein [Pedobacter panaciterrae]